MVKEEYNQVKKRLEKLFHSYSRVFRSVLYYSDFHRNFHRLTANAWGLYLKPFEEDPGSCNLNCDKFFRIQMIDAAFPGGIRSTVRRRCRIYWNWRLYEPSHHSWTTKHFMCMHLLGPFTHYMRSFVVSCFQFFFITKKCKNRKHENTKKLNFLLCIVIGLKKGPYEMT